MKKKPLKLVPNTGSDLAKLRDAANVSSLLLAALVESLAREQSPVIKRLLEIIRRHREEAILGKANKYEIEIFDRAFGAIQDLIIASKAK